MKKIKILGIILVIIGVTGVLGVIAMGIFKNLIPQLTQYWLLIYLCSCVVFIIGGALIALWLDKG